MKEYLRMKNIFPEGVYVDNDHCYNGWSVIQIKYKNGAVTTLDDSGDGGFYEETANYIAHAVNEHDGLVEKVRELEAKIAELIEFK